MARRPGRGASARSGSLPAEVRPRADAAMSQAEHDHRALAAALDPIVTIDASGTILSVSNSIESLLGWSPIELVGRSVGILIPDPERARHDESMARYRRTGKTTILGRARRLEALHRDGTRVPVVLCVSRAESPGAEPLFVGIMHHAERMARPAPGDGQLHDLLAEQTAALQSAHLRLRMADRMASVGTLSAGLGHDMNNVLLPVRAHLNALAAQVRTAAARRHIEAVRGAVAYLQQLSDGLHYLALDPDRENLEEHTDLGHWWRQAGAILLKAVPRHVHIEAAMPRGLPDVRVAPHRLTQAVLNLVVNAGEAIPPARQGHVRVWAEATGDGCAVRLGVTDNGEGMTPEVRRRAFEIFFTTKPRGLGTGLGLALVRNIADHAGGSVDIESVEGRGTTVSMLLPAWSRGRGHPARGRATTVAISVDDARATDLLRQLLEHAGAAVIGIGGPGDATLWIAAPRGDRLETAGSWRKADARRKLVLFGPPPPRTSGRWKSLRPTIIDRPDDLDSVRSAISGALAQIGTSPPTPRP